VLVAVIILVGFFSMQHYGTDKVSWLFAPIVLLWFLLIGSIGIFNIWKYGSSVLKAFSPVYIYRYFRKGGKDGWTSLGGIMLSITGMIQFYCYCFPSHISELLINEVTIYNFVLYKLSCDDLYQGQKLFLLT